MNLSYDVYNLYIYNNKRLNKNIVFVLTSPNTDMKREKPKRSCIPIWSASCEQISSAVIAESASMYLMEPSLRFTARVMLSWFLMAWKETVDKKNHLTVKVREREEAYQDLLAGPNLTQFASTVNSLKHFVPPTAYYLC